MNCDSGTVHLLYRFLTVAAATVVVGSLSGCALACNEAGYTNVLEVIVMGEDRFDVASMQLCTEAGCIDGAQSNSQNRWVFELFADAPQTPQVTASDAIGATLASMRLAVDWEVTTEPNGAGCDNRSTASPVTLEVP